MRSCGARAADGGPAAHPFRALTTPTALPVLKDTSIFVPTAAVCRPIGIAAALAAFAACAALARALVARGCAAAPALALGSFFLAAGAFFLAGAVAARFAGGAAAACPQAAGQTATLAQAGKHADAYRGRGSRRQLQHRPFHQLGAASQAGVRLCVQLYQLRHRNSYRSQKRSRSGESDLGAAVGKDPAHRASLQSPWAAHCSWPCTRSSRRRVSCGACCHARRRHCHRRHRRERLTFLRLGS